MIIDHINSKPIPHPLDLSFLAERVLTSLSTSHRLNDADREIIRKAVQFLEEAQRGNDAVRNLELSATTSRDIQSFSLAKSAYESSTGKQIRRLGTVHKQMIAKLIDTANQLTQQESIQPQNPEIQRLRDFFEATKNITSRLNAGEIDRVKIG